MAASYPSSVKSFSTKLAGQTISAAHVNDIQDEVVALENEGLNGFAHVLKPSAAGGQDLGTAGVPWGNGFLTGLKLTDATTLTLATDAATVIHSYHALDTEGAAASDNCATLTAGAGVAAGFIVVLRAADVTHVVTVKDGTGNLLLNGDYAMNATDRTITLIYDGTNWREIARSVTTSLLDKSTTEQSIANSAAVTSIYAYSVLGGTLGTNRAIRLTVTGKYLNNSGGADNLWIRVQFGGVTIVGAVSAGGTLAGPATSANWRSFTLVVVINANGATNSQRVAARATLGAASATETDWGAVSTDAMGIQSALAVDSTAAQTLDVSIQLGTAVATVGFKRFLAMTELF